MKTRTTILSGVLALALIMLAAQVSVLAGETSVEGGPNGHALQVYLLKKTFDICDQDGKGYFSGNDNMPGGSVPPSGQQFGCVDYENDRFNEYLFTGEQIGILVAVRSVNGAEHIVKADLALDGELKVKCNDITNDVTGIGATASLPGGW